MRSGSLAVLGRALMAVAMVFIVLGILLVLFTSRIDDLEDRKNALLLAGLIMNDFDQYHYPEIGVYDSTVVSGGESYEIRRVVSEISPGLREMKVYIENDGRRNMELTRMFSNNSGNYMNGGRYE